MQTLRQSPTDPAFVQDPYPFYAGAQEKGPLHFWQDYGMVAAFSHEAVTALLRDRRFGREIPPESQPDVPPHLAPFYAFEAHSLLQLEPPNHTRIRSLLTRAFTSSQVSALAPGIAALCHRLIDAFPAGPFDLLRAYCDLIPVITITRLLGVPEDRAQDFLRWSHDMVAMYQAKRDYRIECAAARATVEFSDFIRAYVERRRGQPEDDLISRLIAAESDGSRLSTDELVTTLILLLNAGHEATVHSLGNAVKCLLDTGDPHPWLLPDAIAGTVEETLRYDPPLHMFTRYAYDDIDLFGHRIRRGEEIALMLGAANRDPSVWPDPARFDPTRAPLTNSSFGGGLHFCIGTPLARLEMQIALQILFDRCPNLTLTQPARYSDTYHFHGLDRLMVTV